MTDMSRTIIAKSNQLNADDLMGGSITIKITSLKGVAGDQPIAVGYEGDNNKPWMPCKSMRRVMVAVWGNNGSVYVGRYLTLYRDPAVLFGGLAVGGIRISHMSHIDKPFTVVLTATKKTKAPFVVQPLKVAEVKPVAPATTEPATPDKYFVAMATGAQKGFPTITAWRDYVHAGLLKTKPEQIGAFIQRNNPLFAEYRAAHPDEVDEILLLCGKLDEEPQL